MLDDFSIAFIIFLIAVAEFAFGWKCGQSWEKQKGEDNDRPMSV